MQVSFQSFNDRRWYVLDSVENKFMLKDVFGLLKHARDSLQGSSTLVFLVCFVRRTPQDESPIVHNVKNNSHRRAKNFSDAFRQQ